MVGALAIMLAPVYAAWSAGIDSLQRFYDQTRDLQTEFEQQQMDDSGAILQKSSGTFSLQRPQRFRWEYKLPYRQTMVSDGNSFWFYDVDLAQVTKRSVADALQGTPALLLSGGPTLKQQFKLEEQGSRNGLDWVRLTPRNTEGDFADIRLGLSGSQPKVMELRDNLGQLTRISFSRFKLNPGLKPDLFSFKVPAGVEVVEGEPKSVELPAPK